ncbi:phosphoglycerate kinase [Leucobacter sp. OLJS4]|uniref:phosphoglycerate kinase n=1 Tax=unclassified Leucobacter TaxID=2621730 RepID=UPI000C187D75|nr:MULTISPECIES: phosphoglycerate kinase [unclassified Leucobacter]PII81518.1 phosphoglycerate kinase [Leucobacter sp. OLCALW19]PII86190.1 phosphoglycerate kinase [Leucobacter sp. OLTLW20]PII90085.1 phosphoglycerate kinase [Leucobacter sp. OLAS13]PII97118.1 phosphoglycerate kinase [Leucobacter sp. OLDS2]PIJ02188.1 phosphoglycerate kinase [Leucobacter sp. OLIS6]
MRTIESLGQLRSKTVIVRCDLNVPLADGEITDDGRIRASLTTIRELREAGARIVLISHLGRPAGAPEERYSLRPVAVRMAELLGAPVAFVGETVGTEASAAVSALGDGDVVLLENLRFNPGETSKDAEERRAFAARLAEFGDAFVSDGFGVVHRRQASVTELAEALPSAAGRLVEAELRVLERLTVTPERPYAVVLGGSKVSDKLGVISHLIERVDTLLIGGGMVFTFLAAQGHEVASSLLEADQLDTVRGYLADAEKRGVRIVLPTDIVVAERFAADAAHEVVAADAIDGSSFGESGIGLDIGPASAAAFAEVISEAKTVFWNGPMGVFEMAAFAEGTRTVARALTETDGFTVVGGGDSAAAVRALGFRDDQFGHISTGGGASLEFLEGKTLPGLEVLA